MLALPESAHMQLCNYQLVTTSPAGDVFCRPPRSERGITAQLSDTGSCLVVLRLYDVQHILLTADPTHPARTH